MNFSIEPHPPTELHLLDVATLEAHPWQVNVPDMQGAAWDEFLADIQKRGIQDPIRVSYRTGSPVIVDGHQRTRAARELGLDRLPGMVQAFESEAEEVEHLAGAARFRRNLTDAQKYAIAAAYKTYFKRIAEANVGGRPSQDAQKLTQNFAPVSKDERSTNARAAATVGMNRETFRQAEVISNEAPAAVKDAWQAGEVPTYIAHELTRKAPDPLRKALDTSSVSVKQAVAIQKNPELSRSVASGEKTPEQAASLADMIDAQFKRRDQETGEGAFHKMTRLLTSVTDVSAAEWEQVHRSVYNQQMGDTFEAQWVAAARYMLSLAEQNTLIEVRTIDAQAVN